ncbi:MAG TPA: hypothetical protein VFP35_01700 [Candidatus Saccharimonadales bacterium]|nr:hypothetical protein [Candidatus Saccharimonadales bacterium]
MEQFPSRESDNEKCQRWLTDARSLADFSSRDSAVIDLLLKSDRGASLFARQQEMRQRYLAAGYDDIIADQLRVLRKNFGGRFS